MSQLVIGNNPSAYGLSGGWDIFGKKAKERRKERVQLSAQSFTEKMTMLRYEQERSAVETFRQKIAAKLNDVETVASEAAAVIEQVRRLAEDPVIEGDPVLEEVDKQLADFEEGLVQIQAGTVVDTATFDTHRLAISYSDAQAALIGMTSLKTRAAGMLEDLRQRIQGVGAEKIRMAQLRQEREKAQAQEARRQDALQMELDLKRREEAQVRRQQEQRAVFEQIRKLGRDLADEKRKVDTLRRKIAEVRRRRAEKQEREASAVARKASLAAMRGRPRVPA